MQRDKQNISGYSRLTKLFFQFILIMILFSSPGFSAEKLKLPLLWTSNLKSFLESAPIVADINNNGRDEILVAGQEEMIALGKGGQQLWRWKTRGRFMTYPTVLKRAGKSALIYAADFSGQFTCLNGEGRVVWQKELNGPSDWSASVVYDLDGDGMEEVVQTDGKGTVWAFDALTGRVIWKATVKGKPVSPAIGDVDGDGNAEIVVATNKGIISALHSDGTLFWEQRIGGGSKTWATNAPVIFAASDGMPRVAVASSDGVLYCLDANGKTLWNYPARGPVASAISVGDFDWNGQADIFMITQTGVVYRFNESGQVLWDIDMQGRSLAPGAIIDINDDGKLEYVLCTQRGHLLALNNSGETIFDYQFDNRTINVTPAFGDVTRGSNNLEMVITGGESGKTFCFGTPALKKSPAQWPTYRGNIQNTGSWFGLAQANALRMIPQNLVWNQLFTGQDVRFTIYNPKPGKVPLKATAECIRPDGAKQVAISAILGKQGQFTLPVNFSAPGVYHFEWSLLSGNGRLLLGGKRELSLQPFANDHALVQRAIEALTASANQVVESLPLSAKALHSTAFQLQTTNKTLRPMQDAVPGSDATTIQETLDKTAALIRKAERAMAISDVVRTAPSLGSGTSLIAFEGKKWENRGIDQQLPLHIENPVNIKHTVVPGEHQPIPLVLFNITDHLLNVRVQIGQADSGIVITPLHSVATPTSLGEESWDALPEMDESGVLSIPPLSSREVWLDVSIGSVRPGEHEMNIFLQALNGAGVLDAPTNPHVVAAPETKVQLVLDVLPFQMAPAGDFRLCTWSPSSGPNIPDLLAHGNNVFLAPQGTPLYDGHTLTGIDFSKLDAIVSQFKGHDVFLLLHGFPGIKGEFGSENYKNDLETFLNKLVRHLQNMGIDTNHFALYPIDEPGGHGWSAVSKLVNFGQIVRAINPDVMLYQDGGGELPMFKAMSTCVDVWVPPIDWLPEETPEMDVMRHTGKFLWSYNCSYSSARPVGPNIKNINLLYEFRTAALLALRSGANGIGYWCYNAGRDNPWTRIALEYNLVYPGRTKPVTSRRWEAVREGIEDYRILAALQDTLKKDTISADVRSRINHLLNVSLPHLVDPGFQAVIKLGLSRDAIDNVMNDNKMDAFRNEMIDCVKAVSHEIR